MIKLSVFNFEIDDITRHPTFLVDLLLLEFDYGLETSLLTFGWYQKEFMFDLLYFHGIKNWLNNKSGGSDE